MSLPKICLVIKDFHAMIKMGKCAKNKLTCYTQNNEKEVAVIYIIFFIFCDQISKTRGPSLLGSAQLRQGGIGRVALTKLK